MQFTIIQIIVLVLIGYICLYALVDRIMKCIEHCATAKAYSQLKQVCGTENQKDFVRLIEKWQC